MTYSSSISMRHTPNEEHTSNSKCKYIRYQKDGEKHV